MSLRHDVDSARIDQFLRRLGERFRHPARLYLVGGATIVLNGYRPSTVDIDLTYEVGPDHHAELVEQVRSLQRELSLNVEEGLLAADEAERIEKEAWEEIREAVAWAESQPDPDPAGVWEGVYAMEQLCNQAAKIRFMFGGKATVPLVVRLPGGSDGGAQRVHEDLRDLLGRPANSSS